jgi:hypothetical protein
MYENLCGNCVHRIELTVHSRAILKIVKSMCNGIIVIIHQGREDIFLSRGSLFPEKRSFEGNKEARLKIVFSTVVYILFFSLLDTLKPFLIIIIN